MADHKSEKNAAARRRIKRALAETAPRLAQALGGPFAAAAASAISRALFGDDHASDEMIDAALPRLSADQLVALKRAELDFESALAKASVEETRIHASDRASARERQRAMNDRTPVILGALIIAGFFIVLAAMVTGRLPAGAETEFSIMLGALATMTAAVVNYFFGSSAGSKEKTRLIASAQAPDETR